MKYLIRIHSENLEYECNSGPKKPWQPETWQDSTLFFLPGNRASFSTFWAISLLKYPGNLEIRGKIHWREFTKIQWRRHPEIADFCPLSCLNASWAVIETGGGNFDNVNIWCIVFFLFRSPSPAAHNHGAWVGLINCLAARDLVLNSPSFCRISREKTSKFSKKAPVYKLPQGAIYKPPCVQLISNPFFVIHQVFALSITHYLLHRRSIFGLSAPKSHNRNR